MAPVHIGWPGSESPELFDVLDVVTQDSNMAEWVMAIYIGKFERAYLDNSYYQNYGGVGRQDRESWPEILRMMETYPQMMEMRKRREQIIIRITKNHA